MKQTKQPNFAGHGSIARVAAVLLSTSALPVSAFAQEANYNFIEQLEHAEHSAHTDRLDHSNRAGHSEHSGRSEQSEYSGERLAQNTNPGTATTTGTTTTTSSTTAASTTTANNRPPDLASPRRRPIPVCVAARLAPEVRLRA
jgi:hypothetical protein